VGLLTPFFFILGLSLITAGLLPYRKSVKIQSHPHQIAIDQEQLFFAERGTLTLSIPLTIIERIDFKEFGDQFGLAILLKNRHNEKIIVHKNGFNAADFSNSCLKKFHYHFFFPYFPKKTVSKIVEDSHDYPL
jgi:hypothetical protein